MQYTLNGIEFLHPLGCDGVEYQTYEGQSYAVVYYSNPHEVWIGLPDGKGGLVNQPHLRWHRNNFGIGSIVPV